MPDSSEFVGGGLEYGTGGTPYAAVGGAEQLGGIGPTSKHPKTIREDVVPVGETEVGPGDRVHAVDGEIGRVQGFLVTPGDGRVTHVLLQEGHLWGRKEVAIPISAVTGVDAGIRVNLTKQQIGTYHRPSDPAPARGLGSIPCASRDLGCAGGWLPSAAGARYSRLGLPVVILFHATVWDRGEGRLGTRRTGVPDGHENSLLHQLLSSGSIQGKSVDDRQRKCHISV